MQSGDGGNGCISFRRERCVPEGGPDGGNGGRGGSVIFQASAAKETLIDFVHQVHFKAKRGENGSGACRYGANGDDLIIHIPLGTQIWNDAQDIMFFDATQDGQQFVIAAGGKGGVGNAKYATSTNQTPKFAKLGEKGEAMWVRLVLKLFADIGYVGFPNAGKSSLLKLLTGSKTKVANYPFTTLSPQLGALWRHDTKLLMADLPGIIYRAHEGKGLGFQFLGHIERCAGILHIIDATNTTNCDATDPSGRDGPIDDATDPSCKKGGAICDALDAMLYEIKMFSPKLLEKKQVVVLNKIDLLFDDEVQAQVDALQSYGFAVFPISCVDKRGIDKLVEYLFQLKEGR